MSSEKKISKPLIYWQQLFKDAHQTSWPTASLGMGKDIFDRDEDVVLQAAKEFGYKIVQKTKSIVRFMREQ